MDLVSTKGEHVHQLGRSNKNIFKTVVILQQNLELSNSLNAVRNAILVFGVNYNGCVRNIVRSWINVNVNIILSICIQAL